MESIKAEEITSKFLVDSNNAVNIRLVRSSKDFADAKTSFHPAMTHQIFGQKENIFGYSNLNINLNYTAGKLTQYYHRTADETISRDSGGVEPDDIEEKLNKFEILQQENSATNSSHFEEMLGQDRKFRPHGTKITEYKRGEQIFEVYKATMNDTGFLEWYLRLETFIMWFIDGASYVDTDDNQWDYYILFEKFKNEENNFQYAVAGFSTVFRFYAYPEMIRPRVSQMLVLPPFQKKGLAAEMLGTITSQYHSKDVLEITMEDPSPQFQRVRDFIDARTCVNLREFGPDRLAKGFDLSMYSAAREAAKINRKQARRVYEILRYRSIPKYNEEKMKAFRINIKNRLNAPYKNEALRKKRIMIQTGVQLSDEDRKKLLHAEYEELIEQYQTVINRIDQAACNMEDN